MSGGFRTKGAQSPQPLRQPHSGVNTTDPRAQVFPAAAPDTGQMCLFCANAATGTGNLAQLDLN